MPDLVTVSVVGGMVIAALAILVAQTADRPGKLLVAALLLTLAICVHHFVAMGAIDLTYNAAAAENQSLLSPIELSLAIAAFTAAVVIAASSLP